MIKIELSLFKRFLNRVSVSFILLLFVKTAISQNLVINGDFSSGNTGFTTNYTYCNSGNCLFPYVNDAYSIGINANFFHSVFQGHDHTSGSGNMMIFNGGIPSYSAWGQTISVLPSTTYSFSIWVCSVYINNIANLNFSINGSSIGTLTPSSSYNIWTQFTATWNSNSNTSAAINVNSLNTTGSNAGVDFGLDDIYFGSVNVNPTSQFSAPSLTVCSGQTVNFTNTSINATSYSWNFGDLGTSTLQFPSHIYYSPNIYTVTLVSSNSSSTATSTINITVLPNPTVSIAGNTIICNGSTTTLTAIGANSYSWNNGAITSSVNVSPSITNTYTVIGTLGSCTSQAIATVSVDPGPQLSITGNTVICTGENTTLNATGAVIYSWSNGAITSSVNLSPSITTNYFLSGSMGAGTCTGHAIITVSVNAIPIVNITGNSLICLGNSTMLTANGANGYNWSNGVTTSSVLLTPSSTSTYTVIGSIGSCTNQVAVTVSVNPIPQISVTGNTVICFGEITALNATGMSTYSWNNGAITSSVNLNPSITSTYTVIGTSGSCTNQAVATISVNPEPQISIKGNTVICIGENTTLNATGVNNYSWSNGAVTPTINVAPLLTTTYSFYSSVGTCTGQAIVTVSVNMVPHVSITGDTIICSGSSTNLTANGANSYIWSSGVVSSSVLIVPLSTTVYTVTGFIGNCTDQAIITINVNANPVLTSSLVIASGCLGNDGKFIISQISGGVDPYMINFNSKGFTYESEFDYLTTETYNLQIKDANNCLSSYSVFIPTNGDGSIYIPNTFTPNNDKINDEWRVSGTCIIEFNCIIYNRWGNKITELTSLTDSWNGSYKGLDSPDGVYVYVIQLTVNKDEIHKTGHITLIR